MALEAQDLLWLLLPLAAASGWYAARRDQRRPAAAPVSPDYFRGINYLLNEQPDKAIEVFTRMLEVNTETVETHLALGGLFRRRGEVERAIRIHQNLIARSTLDAAQRSQALCELAQDYLKAGLLDRAENLFLELAEIPTHLETALRALMAIYEQEKEWHKAIVSARRLALIVDSDLGPLLAQYHCEMGEHALQAANLAHASSCAGDALAADAGCVRASIISGRVAAAQGKEREAIVAWQKIEQQDAALLDEVLDEMVAAFRRLNDEQQLYAYLHDVACRQPGIRTLLTLTQLILVRDGQSAAQTFIAERLRQQPSVAGLKRLIDLQVMQDSPASRENLGLVKDILDLLVAQQEGYQCRQCGFRGQTLHWQCPACHAWISMQPASGSDIPMTSTNNEMLARPLPILIKRKEHD